MIVVFGRKLNAVSKDVSLYCFFKLFENNNFETVNPRLELSNGSELKSFRNVTVLELSYLLF